MNKEKQIDYKAYARQMRENCVRDHNGTEPIVICSLELWEEIATIIERFGKQSELSPCDVCQFDPPSSFDGKPCAVCPAQPKMRKEDEGK